MCTITNPNTRTNYKLISKILMIFKSVTNSFLELDFFFFAGAMSNLASPECPKRPRPMSRRQGRAGIIVSQRDSISLDTTIDGDVSPHRRTFSGMHVYRAIVKSGRLI